MVAPHPIQERLVEAALALPPPSAVNAPQFAREGIAGAARSLIDACPFSVLVFAIGQQLASQASVRIVVSALGEAVLAEAGRACRNLHDRHENPQPRGNGLSGTAYDPVQMILLTRCRGSSVLSCTARPIGKWFCRGTAWIVPD